MKVPLPEEVSRAGKVSSARRDLSAAPLVQCPSPASNQQIPKKCRGLGLYFSLVTTEGISLALVSTIKTAHRGLESQELEGEKALTKKKINS